MITLKDNIQSLIIYFDVEFINLFTGHISKAIRAYSQDALKWITNVIHAALTLIESFGFSYRYEEHDDLIILNYCFQTNILEKNPTFWFAI